MSKYFICVQKRENLNYFEIFIDRKDGIEEWVEKKNLVKMRHKEH